MIRLFVGIDLPETVKESLHNLGTGLVGAKWREKERMHITLRFIGNVDEQTADEVLRELRYVRFPAFHIGCKGLGYFDTGGVPHHLWAGVDSDKVLRELHDKIDNAVKKAGAGNQASFKFAPHITLAKLHGTRMEDVFGFISANNLFKTEPFLADSFSLFASYARENGEGKYYDIIESYPLSLV